MLYFLRVPSEIDSALAIGSGGECTVHGLVIDTTSEPTDSGHRFPNLTKEFTTELRVLQKIVSF
jgi:hypothetical protein